MAFELGGFVRAVGIYGMGRLIGAFVPLATLPLLTRMLDIGQFGLVDLLVGFATIAGTLISGGLVGSYNYYVGGCDDAASRRKVTMAVLHWHLAWGLLLMAALWLAAPMIFSLITDKPIPPAALALVLLFALMQQLNGFTFNVLRMAERAWAAVLLTIFTSLASALGAVAAMYWAGPSVTTYFAGYAGGFLCGGVTGYVLIRSDLALVRIDLAEIRRLLAFGLPLLAGLLSETALVFIDRAIVAGLLSVDDLGVYALAVRLGNLALVGVQSVTLAFLPIAMRLIREPDRAAASAQLGMMWRYTTLIFYLGSIVGALVAPLLVTLAAPPDYSAAAGIVPILMLGHIFYGFTYFTYLGTLRAERTSLYTVSVVTGAAVNVASSLLLIPVLGLFGAAGGTLLGTLVTAILSLAFSQKVWPFDFPLARIGLMTVACAVAQALIFLSTMWGQTWWSLVVAATAAVVFAPLATHRDERRNAGYFLAERLRAPGR